MSRIVPPVSESRFRMCICNRKKIARIAALPRNMDSGECPDCRENIMAHTYEAAATGAHSSSAGRIPFFLDNSDIFSSCKCEVTYFY